MFTAAQAYEQFMGRWGTVLAHRYIAFAQPVHGGRVLDVGCGTGALAVALAQALPHAEVSGVDPSATFIDLASARSASPRLRFDRGDAQELPYATASFDHVLSQLVLNFVPDPRQAVAEMKRVTRAGGVVSACVWDYGQGMEMLRRFWDEAVALDPAAESRDERHMKLCRPGELSALWRDVGLAAVRDEALTIEQRFTSFADYWAPFRLGAGPAGAYVASLTAAQCEALENGLRARLVGTKRDGPFALNARAWAVRGEVPPAAR